MLFVFIYPSWYLIHGYLYFSFFSLSLSLLLPHFIALSKIHTSICTKCIHISMNRNDAITVIKYDCWRFMLIESPREVEPVMRLIHWYFKAIDRKWRGEGGGGEADIHKYYFLFYTYSFFCIEILDTIHTIWNILLID
jgi:hypothetical protein